MVLPVRKFQVQELSYHVFAVKSIFSETMSFRNSCNDQMYEETMGILEMKFTNKTKTAEI
jgi:hypothetical protein